MFVGLKNNQIFFNLLNEQTLGASRVFFYACYYCVTHEMLFTTPEKPLRFNLFVYFQSIKKKKKIDIDDGARKNSFAQGTTNTSTEIKCVSL